MRFLRTIREIPAARLAQRARSVFRRRTGLAYRIPRYDEAAWQRSALVNVKRFCLPEVHVEAVQDRFQCSVHSQLLSAHQAALRIQGSSPVFPWHPPASIVGRELVELTLHYLDFLPTLSDDDFVRVFREWQACFPIQHHCSWNPYAASLRAVNLCCEFVRRDLEQQSLSFQRLVSRSLYEHFLFIEKNLELDICGNHLIKNLKALIFGARLFQSVDARRWYRIAVGVLKEQLAVQIKPDGMHFELSPHYHWQVLGDLVEIAQLLDEEDRSQVQAVIERMLQVGLHFLHPDRTLAHFSDGVLSPHLDFDKIIEFLGCRPELKSCYVLPSSGYVAARFHADDCFIYDFGQPVEPSLPAHGHADIFSFEWTIAGERFFIDPGVYEYSASTTRNANRSSCFHNTLSLAGESQCEMYGSFRVGRRARVHASVLKAQTGRLHVCGHHDGFSFLPGAPMHEREVLFSGDRLEIIDRVRRESDSAANRSKDLELPARIYFLLHPSVLMQNSFELRRGSVVVRFESTLQPSVEDAHWYPKFGTAVPTKALVFTGDPLHLEARTCCWIESR